MDVYVAADTLKADVAPNGPDELDERLAAAVYLGSRYVDRVLGNPISDAPVTPGALADVLVLVPCDPSWSEAAKAAAAYFYKLVDAPTGYMTGLSEYAVKVRPGSIPTADAFLVGRIGFLIA